MQDQPIDIVAENVIDHALGIRKIKISSYANREPVWLEVDGSCIATSAHGATLAEWPSLANWVKNELRRFSSYLDKDARPGITFAKIPPPGRVH